MSNYPIADMLVRIKNAYLARRGSVTIPYSKTKHGLASILFKRGFIENVKLKKSQARKELVVTLKFSKRKAALRDVKIVSKPSLRVYVSQKDIPRGYGRLGIVIISTSKGLMTGDMARKKGLGGEFIGKVW